MNILLYHNAFAQAVLSAYNALPSFALSTARHPLFNTKPFLILQL